jgi:ABC-type polysaccharide/polyol phosphate transport system ATPase subunit
VAAEIKTPSSVPSRDGQGIKDASVAVAARDLHKGFWIQEERMLTLKERILHPRANGGRRLEVLDGIDFEVQKGEFFGIVGRNGSGKSTLLKCMAGIYQPDSGQIDVNGRLATFIELGVGFNPDLTAYDNVAINATLMGMPVSGARERFDEVIAFAELEDFTGLKLRNYSSGMLVRLAFAISINADADVMIFDEVLAVGDLAFQNKCFDVFDDIKRGDRTVVFVTHSMDLVHRFCDRAMMIEDGRISAIGDTSDVALRYEQVNYGATTPLEAVDEDGLEVTSRNVGDGSAQILNPRLEWPDGAAVESCSQGDELRFVFDCEFVTPMEAPIFGVTFLDETHMPIFATNSEIDELPTRTFAAGDRTTFSVEFTVLFERGTYFACPAVAHGGGKKFADFIDRACVLYVRSSRDRMGVANFPHRSTLQ